MTAILGPGHLRLLGSRWGGLYRAVTAHAAVESLTVENLELREELDAAHAECDDWNLTCENYEKSLAVERARVQKVLDLCNDPGGPDSWSHTFDGRASIFVEDVLAAIGDAP